MEKGDILKQTIYDKTKESIAKKGYKNTKMKDIAKDLGVLPSIISYYFKKKEFLLEEIVSDSRLKIFQSISDTLGDIDDPLLMQFVYMRLDYQVITQDTESLRFIYEAFKQGDYGVVNKQTSLVFFEKVCKYYSIKLDKKILAYYSDIFQTIFTNTWINYCEKKYENISEDHIALDAIKSIALLMGIDRNTIESISKKSKALAAKVDIKNIHILK